MFPKDLLYTKSHEWVKIEGDDVTVGITSHAQEELGDIVYVDYSNIYEDGEFTVEEIKKGDAFCSIESVKAVSDVYAPITIKPTEINSDLEDAPETVNQAPYENGWLLKGKMVNEVEKGELLSAEEYEKFVEEEKG